MTDQHDETLSSTPAGTPDIAARRTFLRSLGKWSQAVIGGVLLGGALTESRDAKAWVAVGGGGGGGWINRYGGGGGWINGGGGGSAGWINGGGGGGGWVNRYGGGGSAGWVNRAGGGGGGWINRR
jgi:hypothetical protein